MLVAACLLIIEITVAVVLLRTAHRSVRRGATVMAFFIGVASACATGLAVQGSFLWLAAISRTPELIFVAFWLMVGLIGFAIGTLIKSARAAIALPCAVMGFCALGYGVLLWDEMAACVAAVLVIVALVIWYLAGRFPARQPKHT
jgi:hypothetical protein